MPRLSAVASAVDRRTDRRGFLARTAVAGAALSVAPLRYLLRPGSAYAAVCGCGNSVCDCGSRCCDGYTEFCCTITGKNTCPPGSTTGGWWKADAPGLCGPSAPRYFLDCNTVPPGQPCGCGCANGDCGNRIACCTRFRYGQCHQEIPVMGPIVCRIVTCTPPWQFDAACAPSPVLTDNATRFHAAACTDDPEDEVKRWLMKVRTEPTVYLVDGGLEWRWSVRDSDTLTNVRYVLGHAGVTILSPPPGVPREGDVWLVERSFLDAIPDTTPVQ